MKACVSSQTYPAELIEWIILDDSEQDVSSEFSGPNELYIRLNKRLNVGRKRQFACDIAAGEFFLMTMISIFHTAWSVLQKLQKIGARMVAGNSEMFLADKSSETVIKVGPHHKNHATAATLAFRKEFLKHSGLGGLTSPVRKCTFQNWTIPVVQ